MPQREEHLCEQNNPSVSELRAARCDPSRARSAPCATPLGLLYLGLVFLIQDFCRAGGTSARPQRCPPDASAQRAAWCRRGGQKQSGSIFPKVKEAEGVRRLREASFPQTSLWEHTDKKPHYRSFERKQNLTSSLDPGTGIQGKQLAHGQRGVKRPQASRVEQRLHCNTPGKPRNARGGLGPPMGHQSGAAPGSGALGPAFVLPVARDESNLAPC